MKCVNLAISKYRLRNLRFLTLLSLLMIGLILNTINISKVNTDSVYAAPGQRISTVNQPDSINALLNSNSPEYFDNWSGYAVTSSQQFTKVSTEFTQPTVTCPVPGAWTLFWVGFDGFNNGTVEQAGTAATCSYGTNPTPSYYAWWEMYPTNNIQVAPLNIKPGDTITPSAEYNSLTKNYQLKVTDNTTSKHFTENTTCSPGLNCSRQSAEWIIERPTISSGYSPMANWGTMTFNKSYASIKSAYKPISYFNNTPIDMLNYGTGNNLANVSSLNKQGIEFTDTWLSAQ